MSLNREAITTPVVTNFEISRRYLPRFSIHVFSISGFCSSVFAASSCLLICGFYGFDFSRLVVICFPFYRSDGAKIQQIPETRL